MSKHTPGPWIVTGFDKAFMDQINIRDEKHGYYVAVAIRCQAQEANAHLIAAAPELLEALQDLYKFFTPQSQEESDICVKVETAIAKALNQPITD